MCAGMLFAVSCKKECTCSGSYTVDIPILGTQQTTQIPAYSAGKLSKSDCEAIKYDESLIKAALAGADIDYNLTFGCVSE